MTTKAATVIVFTGGDPVDAAEIAHLPSDVYVIAADSGVEQAERLGRHVDLAVGDFDSADPAAVARAEAAGAVVERHAAAKDATDLELALDAAIARIPDRVVVVGGVGGRLDHTVANLLTLASTRYRGARVDVIAGAERAYVIHDDRTIAGQVGELVTLLALHGPAEGVRTSGLAFPLVGETLEPGSSRGVSNELTAAEARVSIEQGILLAILPGVAGPGLTPTESAAEPASRPSEGDRA